MEVTMAVIAALAALVISVTIKYVQKYVSTGQQFSFRQAAVFGIIATFFALSNYVTGGVILDETSLTNLVLGLIGTSLLTDSVARSAITTANPKGITAQIAKAVYGDEIIKDPGVYLLPVTQYGVSPYKATFVVHASPEYGPNRIISVRMFWGDGQEETFPVENGTAIVNHVYQHNGDPKYDIKVYQVDACITTARGYTEMLNNDDEKSCNVEVRRA